MDETMIRAWNETVAPGDEVWYLGDFAMSKHTLHRVVTRLNGIIFFIPGNHDECFPFDKRTESRKKRGRELFESLGVRVMPRELILQVDGVSVLLSHFPRLVPRDEGKAASDSSHEARYPEYRPLWRGDGEDLWLLHGHIHEKAKIQTAMRQINVGVDVWNFRPVPWREIAKIIGQSRRRNANLKAEAGARNGSAVPKRRVDHSQRRAPEARLPAVCLRPSGH